MYYHLHLFRRLCRIFPRELLQVYKSYTQHRLYDGSTLYGCSSQKNIDLVQGVKDHAASLITGNSDHVDCRGIELIESLDLYGIRKNVNRHTAHTIVSWPNPKQWIIIHTNTGGSPKYFTLPHALWSCYTTKYKIMGLGSSLAFWVVNTVDGAIKSTWLVVLSQKSIDAWNSYGQLLVG